MDPPLDPSIPSHAEVPPVDHAAEPAAASPRASGAPARSGIASPGAAGRAPVPPSGGNPPPDDPDDDGSSRHSSPGDIPPSGGGPPSGGPHPPDTSSLGSDDILQGHDWRKHHIDPRRLDELCVYWNKGVRSIHPWEFKRSETGNTINYPVRLDTGVASKTEFMNELGTEPRLGSEVHSLKSFSYGFPKVVENATKSDLCHWYSAVVDHCVSYGIFVAPFHTHTPGSTMGKWWEDAPAWCQEESHRRYCEHQLHQALVGKAANLSYSPIVKHLLRERRGYEIMYKIAKICGHPALTDSLSLIPIPTQKANMDLLEYLERWKHHAYIAFCHGITYSDRYFTEEFINRMHSTFDLSLKPYLFHLIRRVEVDVPVPFCWWPDQILTHILDVAPRLGLPLTTDTTPTELQPRKSRGSELRSTSRHKDVTPSSTREHPVRELDSEEIHRVDELYINQLADVHGLAVAINSLVAASSGADKSCHFCGESSHLLRDCPIFQAILKDPM